jgi:hypothetical protein
MLGFSTRRYTRQILVVTAVAAIAALAGSSALAAPGHRGPGPRGAAAHGFFVLGGPGVSRTFGMSMRGFGADGPGFGLRVFGHGPFAHRGPHRPGLHGPLSGALLAKSASYIGITPAQLGAGLKDGKTLAQLATANGKTAAGLVQALVDDAEAGLEALVAAGWLTQAQADRAVERITKGLTTLVNEGPKARKGPLDPAATYLGLKTVELHAALRSGKSLAEIATEQGKTVEGLVEALTADAKAKLAAAVTAKKLTQEQADRLLAGLTERVTGMVNRKPRAKRSPAASTAAALKSALALKLVLR